MVFTKILKNFGSRIHKNDIGAGPKCWQHFGNASKKGKKLCRTFFANKRKLPFSKKTFQFLEQGYARVLSGILK